jgi:two-component system phosphate regulon response regulator PhoB
VDVYVRRIREKIEENPDEPRYLRTVRGAGYRFEIPKS